MSLCRVDAVSVSHGRTRRPETLDEVHPGTDAGGAMSTF